MEILIKILQEQNSKLLATIIVAMIVQIFKFIKFLYKENDKKDKEIYNLKLKLHNSKVNVKNLSKEKKGA